MPLTANSNYTATIGGRRVRMAAKATVTLPGSVLLDITGAITDVQLSCSMSTPLPDGVHAPSGDTVLDGSITLSGTVVVSGQAMTVADLFDRQNLAPTNPMRYLSANGCKVVYQIGPRIRGQVDANGKPLIDFKTQADTWINGYTVDRAAGTVTFTLTDVPPTWDQTPAIPPVITDPPFNAGLTGEFAMDNLIRQMDGASSWPAQRPGCVLAAGMRSSLWAEVGYLDTGLGAIMNPPTFVTGAFGTALTFTGGQQVFYGFDPVATGTGMFLECWITWPPDAGSRYAIQIGAAGVNSFLVSVYSDHIDFDSVAVRHTWNTSTIGFTYLSVALAWPVSGSNYTATATVGTTTHTWTASMGISHDALPWDYAQINGAGTTSFEAFQVSAEAAPASNAGFYPHFVCDTSLNPLTAIPAIDKDTAPWDELQTIAAAECGLIQRIPDSNDASGGQLRFTNRLTLIGYDPARGRTITSLDSLKAYTDEVPPSAAVRTVEVPYSEWDFGAESLVWSATARKKIPARSTISWIQPLPDGALAAAVDTSVSLLPTSGYPTSGGGSFYLASVDAAGTAAHPGLDFDPLVLIAPGRVQITVHNRTSTPAVLAVPATYAGPFDAGTPAFWIGGIPVTVGQEAVARATVGSGLGVLQVSSNPYIQDHDTALTLARFLRDRLYVDVDEFNGVDLMPDGTILCGDLEKVTDQYGHLDDWMHVWGWTHDASWQPGQPPTFEMTADLRPLTSPGAALVGFPVRGDVANFYIPAA